MRLIGQASCLRHWGILGILALLLTQCGPSQPARVVPVYGLSILGESWALRATQGARLRNEAIYVRSIYGFDKLGQKQTYVEGQDWLFADGAIRRTAESRIPDFSGYQFHADIDGRFEFSSSPRNPGLILGYQIYVDYRSTRPDRLIHALCQGPIPRSILCVGDSITAGAQTIGEQAYGDDRDSYCGLLRRYLGAGFLVKNSSVVGGVLETFRANLDAYLVDPPQAVIIGFGMNDHLVGSQGLAEFTQSLSEVVARLRAHQVRVILMGFFQQNKLWTREAPVETVAYNHAIQSVAAECQVPFVDVYEVFQGIATERDLVDHLTADFMHHPNNYGQRVYFSLLVPYFMAEDAMVSSIDGFIP